LGYVWLGYKVVQNFYVSFFLQLETKCIGYHGTKMSWMKAGAMCQQMQGDLISLHDNTILPLIYQVTGENNRRKKRVEIATDKTVAWTSAHAIQLTNCKSSFFLHSSCTN
jgi:hypothetical protein